MIDNFIYEEQKQLIKMWKEHCEEIKQQRDTLQSNWNSLREWIKENSWYYNTSDGCQWVDQFKLLDKINELEGEDNNGVMD